MSFTIENYTQQRVDDKGTYTVVHPYYQAIANAQPSAQLLFDRAKDMLVNDYGYNFTKVKFEDFFGHSDAYADWLSDNKDEFDDVDYELLTALRFLIDYGYRS
tara:strand:- start:32 stop:340 length:309 start_codon:yes stop_codon:yes gene_type:complete